MIDMKILDAKESLALDEHKLSLRNRGADTSLLDQAVELYKRRKELITQAETAKANQNKVSGEIAILKRTNKDATQLISEMSQLAASVKEKELLASEMDAQVLNLLLHIPNKCHNDVPIGKSSDDNKQVKAVGAPKDFKFKAKEHWEIGESLNIIDFNRAAKTTGTRFAFLKGAGAQLERALIQFMMDVHSQDHGYVEMIPPYIVNSASLTGTGNFPKFKQDVFHLENSDFYLIPTAEVPVTNYYSGEMLAEADLPQKFTAYSACFRSEAGSHGRDTKGLIRQHQFNKIELMVFSHPAKSYEYHEQLTGHAERILELLELPYRRMILCTGDIGFGAAKCFDLEVWLPGQKSFREISSCSNFEDFQARRANIRFRPNPAGGTAAKPQFVHTINGSGLAVGRTLIAVLENYQREDGSIEIPQVLRKYVGGRTEIRN